MLIGAAAEGGGPMSDLPSVVVLGVSAGLQAALLAIGLVLVYRASRFINFAQGQMGAIAAAVLAVMKFELDVPYWVALPVALAAILAAPSQPSALLSGDAGLGLLLRGLAAALVAGMADFRIAFAAGIAVGIAEQATIFYTSARGLPELSDRKSTRLNSSH